MFNWLDIFLELGTCSTWCQLASRCLSSLFIRHFKLRLLPREFWLLNRFLSWNRDVAAELLFFFLRDYFNSLHYRLHRRKNDFTNRFSAHQFDVLIVILHSFFTWRIQKAVIWHLLGLRGRLNLRIYNSLGFPWSQRLIECFRWVLHNWMTKHSWHLAWILSVPILSNYQCFFMNGIEFLVRDCRYLLLWRLMHRNVTLTCWKEGKLTFTSPRKRLVLFMHILQPPKTMSIFLKIQLILHNHVKKKMELLF